jgi:transcription elongation factor GreA-like protein
MFNVGDTVYDTNNLSWGIGEIKEVTDSRIYVKFDNLTNKISFDKRSHRNLIYGVRKTTS